MLRERWLLFREAENNLLALLGFYTDFRSFFEGILAVDVLIELAFSMGPDCGGEKIAPFLLLRFKLFVELSDFSQLSLWLLFITCSNELF